MAALTSAMECWRRWKMEAARTADAPPVAHGRHEVGRARGAARRDDGHGHPVGDRPQQRGVVAGLGPVAVDRGDEQLAGAEVDDPLGPGDGVEARGLAAALDDDLPGRRLARAGAARRRASMATTTAWDPKRRAQRRTRSGVATAAVLSDTLSAPGPQDVAHLGDGPDAAADGERDEGAARRPLDDVEERAAALGRGRDVEEDDLVGALARRSARRARAGRPRRRGRRSGCP